jgi:hypothetical protein
MDGSIRRSAIAGSWYPGHPDTLKRDINTYLGNASVPELKAKPVVVVSPHAGYMYSGPVAAYAYRAVKGQPYARVVVISPSHRAHFPFISLWGEGGYETPLGVLPVDEEFCARLLKKSSTIQEDKRSHVAEHALEIQLPFLQTVLGPFKLCPLIMGQQHLSACRSLADTLAECIAEPDDTLVVASSDLSHFHHYEKAFVMDTKVARLIEAFDIEGLDQALDTGASEACGGGPIMSAMLYAKRIARNTAQVLKYANSGDVTGDRSSVVGYLAAVIY